MSANNRVLVGIRPVEQPSFTTYSYEIEDHFVTEQMLIPSINKLYVDVSGIPVYFAQASTVRAYTECTLYDADGEPWTIDSVQLENGSFRLRSSYKGSSVNGSTAYLASVVFGLTLSGSSATFDADRGFFTCQPIIYAGSTASHPSNFPRPVCRVDDKLIPAAVRREYKLTESKG